MNQVRINKKQCENIGNIVKNYKFRPSFYERELITFKTDEETKARTYLYAVAVCHQTHTLINKKLNLKGWDYLSRVFITLAKDKSDLLNPENLSSLSNNELSNRLKMLFSDDGNPENCTLDRLSERADFLIQTAEIIKEKYSNRITNLLRLTDNFLFYKGKGLYELLEKFPAYSDKLRKKSTVFIKLLEDSGLIKIKDPENFVPVMDYHMQRVMLRTGCVEITDSSLEKKLKNKEKMKSDEEIRRACIEAIKIISKTSGFKVTKLDDFFWSLGRSCCREKILCHKRKCDKNPCTFETFISLTSHDKCIFEKICKGSVDEEYRKYWQPIVETYYY